MKHLQPDPGLAWPIDYDDGVVPIGQDEGCRLKAYRCQAGKWTAGWGETDGVTPTTVWTQDYADQRFCDSLTERTNAVRDSCQVEPTSHQLAALVSLAYNYGGWRTSTALKAHNRGEHLAAARAFGLVNKFTSPATGKLEVSEGLTARRAREAALYLRPAEGAHPIPQVVAPESKAITGPIGSTGVAIGAGGLISVASEAKAYLGPIGDAIGSLKSFLSDSLGVPPEWVLPGLLIVGGMLVVRWRLKQRSEGWA